MNPAFIVLIIIGIFILWFLLSFLYKPIGRLIYKIGKDAINEINEENNKKKENENERKNWSN